MAWRFQASKFKNTTPKLPKKEETIFDLPIGNLSTTDNGIQASASYLAFHIEGEGGKLGAVPVGAKGRRTRNEISVVCAHAEQVSDFNFMTFNDDLLVTCSRDEKVKIWQLNGVCTPQLSTELDVGHGTFLEALKPHSTAANILALGSVGNGFIADVEAQKTVLEFGGIVDKVMSLDWSEDGKLLTVSADKGRQLLAYDPRASADPVQTMDGHSGLGREARVVFAGDQIISSGFTNKRVQQILLYDTKKWGAPIHSQEFVSTTGVLIPHYDADTKLVFLSGKGTNKLFMMEIQDRQPLMSHVFELTLPEQTLGAALGSKRKLAVMTGEVDTYYQLTKSAVLGIPCIVPRRSYRDFHADLYPDTRSGSPATTASEWLAGKDGVPAKISLAPHQGGKMSPPPQEPTPPVARPQTVAPPKTTSVHEPVKPAPVVTKKHEIEEPKPSHKDEIRELDYSAGQENGHAKPKYQAAVPPASVLSKASEPATIPMFAHPSIGSSGTTTAHVPSPLTDKSPIVTSPDLITVVPATKPASVLVEVTDNQPAKQQKLGGVRYRQTISGSDRARPLSQRVRPKSCVVGKINSKYRHCETVAGIKANAIFTNLRNVNTRLSPESNGACASGKFVAVPLAGPAGIVGIYDVDAPGKLPDGVMDGIFNKAQVTDMQWNPFDDGQLAVGTDSGCVNIWRLRQGEDKRCESEPESVLKIGGEKIVVLRWHPLASNLMAIGLSNNTIELWNVREQRLYHRITSHEGNILALAWSADGRRLASLGKDAMLYIHEPNIEGSTIYKRKVLESTRAARVFFACDDRLVVVVGMTKSSGRQIQLYDAQTHDLSFIYSQQVDTGTQPLIPQFDYDTNVLFVTGKGDTTIHMHEVTTDSPYLLPLAGYSSPSVGTQSIAYHQKNKCNVMAVEFQVAWKLTEKTLEKLIIRVPRVKKDVFQADLFPDALVTWEPVMSAEDWISGSRDGPVFRSLQPEGVASSGALGTSVPVRPIRHSDSRPAESPATSSIGSIVTPVSAVTPLSAISPSPLNPSNNQNVPDRREKQDLSPTPEEIDMFGNEVSVFYIDDDDDEQAPSDVDLQFQVETQEVGCLWGWRLIVVLIGVLVIAICFSWIQENYYH